MRALLMLGLIPAACTGGMYESNVVEQGACVALEGRTFTSLAELECGLAPDGIARCRWQVTFDIGTASQSEWSWTHSDVGEVGRVTCIDQAMSATTGARAIPAAYDPVTQRLTWDGVVYAIQ